MVCITPTISVWSVPYRPFQDLSNAHILAWPLLDGEEMTWPLHYYVGCEHVQSTTSLEQHQHIRSTYSTSMSNQPILLVIKRVKVRTVVRDFRASRSNP